MSQLPKRLSAAMPEDEQSLGPAMRALNARQRAFVDALFVLGTGGTYVKAAEMAGYEGGNKALAVTGHRLAHSDKVQEALREEATRRSVGVVPSMIHKLVTIAENDEHRNQLDAIKHTLGIAGVSPKIQHEVVHKTDRASLIQEIAGMVNLLKEQGVALSLEKITEPVTIDVTPEKSNVT